MKQATGALLSEEVRELLGHLQPRERSVIELRFGLGAREPASRQETARQLDLRRDDVRRLERPRRGASCAPASALTRGDEAHVSPAGSRGPIRGPN